jgi:hypothetical protein
MIEMLDRALGEAGASGAAEGEGQPEVVARIGGLGRVGT